MPKVKRPASETGVIINAMLQAKHLPGVSNSIADSLSRLQIQRFRLLAPEVDIVAYYKGMALTDSKKRVYNQGAKAFQNFCYQYNLPTSFQDTTQHGREALLMYLAASLWHLELANWEGNGWPIEDLFWSASAIS